MKRLISLLFGIVIALPVSASDHIDGPVTTSHRVADLTDLFAFPTPNRAGSLTLILNAYPLVPKEGHFTDKVNYSMIVRRAAISNADGREFFATSDEVTINCTFKTPDITADHVVMCRASNGMFVQSRYEIVQDNRAAGIRLYTGMRADPFFFNADFAQDAIAGTLDPPDDSNVMKGVNILTIALEINLSRLYSNPPSMVAVAAETTTRDAHVAALRRLDRVGRPEITNVSMAPRGESDLRDRYNRDRPFQVPAATLRLYEEKLARNIAFYDKLDHRQDWLAPDLEALAKLMADDFLIVDLSKPCPAHSFLEIETAILQHRAHGTCGGRRPSDDIMDRLFTLYVAGMHGKPVRDGVDHPATPLSRSFPYLAAPDLGFWNVLKGWAARKVLGIPDLH